METIYYPNDVEPKGVKLVFEKDEQITDFSQNLKGDIVTAEVYVDRLRAQARRKNLKFRQQPARFDSFKKDVDIDGELRDVANFTLPPTRV